MTPMNIPKLPLYIIISDEYIPLSSQIEIKVSISVEIFFPKDLSNHANLIFHVKFA